MLYITKACNKNIMPIKNIKKIKKIKTLKYIKFKDNNTSKKSLKI
jgi:hypothetical protein